jgi:hypothetical protein
MTCEPAHQLLDPHVFVFFVFWCFFGFFDNNNGHFHNEGILRDQEILQGIWELLPLLSNHSRLLSRKGSKLRKEKEKDAVRSFFLRTFCVSKAKRS